LSQVEFYRKLNYSLNTKSSIELQLLDYVKENPTSKKFFKYLSMRTRNTNNTDVTYFMNANQKKEWGLKTGDVLNHYRKLDEIGIGWLSTNTTRPRFRWFFKLNSVGDVATKKEARLIPFPVPENVMMELNALSLNKVDQSLEELPLDDLINEIENRGWEISLKRLPSRNS